MGFTDFLRKIGLLRASKGDYQTGDMDDRKDMQQNMPQDDNQGMEQSEEEQPKQ